MTMGGSTSFSGGQSLVFGPEQVKVVRTPGTTNSPSRQKQLPSI